METGKTKDKLAILLTDFFKGLYPTERIFCYPEDLKVNRGANVYNDWCSWTGIVYVGNVPYQVHSYETMTLLAKRGISMNKPESPVGTNEVHSLN